MSGFWCSRCEQKVVMGRWRPCGCETGPSPWWYVPTTFFEYVRCLIGRCKHETICANCSPHAPDHGDDVIKS